MASNINEKSMFDYKLKINSYSLKMNKAVNNISKAVNLLKSEPNNQKAMSFIIKTCDYMKSGSDKLAFYNVSELCETIIGLINEVIAYDVDFSREIFTLFDAAISVLTDIFLTATSDNVIDTSNEVRNFVNYKDSLIEQNRQNGYVDQLLNFSDLDNDYKFNIDQYKVDEEDRLDTDILAPVEVIDYTGIRSEVLFLETFKTPKNLYSYTFIDTDDLKYNISQITEIGSVVISGEIEKAKSGQIIFSTVLPISLIAQTLKLDEKRFNEVNEKDFNVLYMNTLKTYDIEIPTSDDVIDPDLVNLLTIENIKVDEETIKELSKPTIDEKQSEKDELLELLFSDEQKGVEIEVLDVPDVDVDYDSPYEEFQREEFLRLQKEREEIARMKQLQSRKAFKYHFTEESDENSSLSDFAFDPGDDYTLETADIKKKLEEKETQRKFTREEKEILSHWATDDTMKDLSKPLKFEVEYGLVDESELELDEEIKDDGEDHTMESLFGKEATLDIKEEDFVHIEEHTDTESLLDDYYEKKAAACPLQEDQSQNVKLDLETDFTFSDSEIEIQRNDSVKSSADEKLDYKPNYSDIGEYKSERTDKSFILSQQEEEDFTFEGDFNFNNSQEEHSDFSIDFEDFSQYERQEEEYNQIIFDSKPEHVKKLMQDQELNIPEKQNKEVKLKRKIQDISESSKEVEFTSVDDSLHLEESELKGIEHHISTDEEIKDHYEDRLVEAKELEDSNYFEKKREQKEQVEQAKQEEIKFTGFNKGLERMASSETENLMQDDIDDLLNKAKSGELDYRGLDEFETKESFESKSLEKDEKFQEGIIVEEEENEDAVSSIEEDVQLESNKQFHKELDELEEKMEKENRKFRDDLKEEQRNIEETLLEQQKQMIDSINNSTSSTETIDKDKELSDKLRQNELDSFFDKPAQPRLSEEEIEELASHHDPLEETFISKLTNSDMDGKSHIVEEIDEDDIMFKEFDKEGYEHIFGDNYLGNEDDILTNDTAGEINKKVSNVDDFTGSKVINLTDNIRRLASSSEEIKYDNTALNVKDDQGEEIISNEDFTDFIATKKIEEVIEEQTALDEEFEKTVERVEVVKKVNSMTQTVAIDGINSDDFTSFDEGLEKEFDLLSVDFDTDFDEFNEIDNRVGYEQIEPSKELITVTDEDRLDKSIPDPAIVNTRKLEREAAEKLLSETTRFTNFVPDGVEISDDEDVEDDRAVEDIINRLENRMGNKKPRLEYEPHDFSVEKTAISNMLEKDKIDTNFDYDEVMSTDDKDVEEAISQAKKEFDEIHNSDITDEDFTLKVTEELSETGEVIPKKEEKPKEFDLRTVTQEEVDATLSSFKEKMASKLSDDDKDLSSELDGILSSSEQLEKDIAASQEPIKPKENYSVDMEKVAELDSKINEQSHLDLHKLDAGSIAESVPDASLLMSDIDTSSSELDFDFDLEAQKYEQQFHISDSEINIKEFDDEFGFNNDFDDTQNELDDILNKK